MPGLANDVGRAAPEPRRPIVLETWRALAEPRRAVPVVLVATSLLTAEWVASASARAVLVDAALVATFVLVSPAAWRALAPPEHRGPRLAAAWALHAALGIAVVGILAMAVPPLAGMRATYVSDPRSLGVLVVLFVVGGWGLGRDVDLEAGVRVERARAERLGAAAEHAQILALRAQLDPHFLFNTLNAIAEWCQTDPAAAEAATLRLSSMLRAIFDALRTPTWALDRELALIEELGALYAARDPARFRLEVRAPADLGAVELPALLLLPLVENAIKHGPARGHAGTVRVSVHGRPDEIEIEIENPGPCGERRPEGHGLAAVERRLALAYGSRATLGIGAHDGRTRAVVAIPRAGPADARSAA